ncbi:hypothetical protein AB1Y20_004496 [Prymnesium parvum]|uniref:Uncharacterized protein n=1 Tax=Prymnesium parvum TaxID=97485 RepID=A0AB34IYX2_PRYPA
MLQPWLGLYARLPTPHCECSHRSCEAIFAEAGGEASLFRECEEDPYRKQCRVSCYDSRSMPSRSRSQHPPRCQLTSHSLVSALSAPSSVWVEDADFCNESLDSSSTCLGNRRWMPGQHISTGRQNSARREHCMPRYRTRKEACSVLAKSNITEVVLIGDSLLRHLYLALNLVFSGLTSYANGVRRGCRASDAFVDGPCGHATSNATWCGGVVKADFTDRRWYGGKMGHLPLIEVPQGRLILHGIGSHPVIRNASIDLNNSTVKKQSGLGTYSLWAYQSKQNFPAQRDFWWNSTCSKRQKVIGQAQGRSMGQVIWIPPHFKAAIGRYDDSNDRGIRFAEETANYFEHDCGGIPTLDFTEPTRAAAALLCRPKSCENNGEMTYQRQKDCKFVVRDTCEDASWITFDGYHWGAQINLLKAQLVLAYLAGD